MTPVLLLSVVLLLALRLLGPRCVWEDEGDMSTKRPIGVGLSQEFAGVKIIL